MDSDARPAVYTSLDWKAITLYLLSIGAAVLCARIVLPFVPALTGAIILAVITRRPFRWVAARLHNRTLAAALALILVIFSIITPTALLAYNIGQHVLLAVQALQGSAPEHELRVFLDQHPNLSVVLRALADNIDPGQALQKTAGAAAGKVGALLTRTIGAVVQIVIMLFVLFFLYRDEREAMRLTRRLLPLASNEADYLLNRVGTAVNALVLGRFLVAGIQGLVAGITFAQLGVNGAVLLGVATMLFALVPAVGAYIIWLPVVIFFVLGHMWIKAIILLAIGSLIISTLDNVLYPILVGSRLRLHTVPIFLSMLGGVWLFGVSGLILGPIIFNVTASLLSIWRTRMHQEALRESDAAQEEPVL